MFSMNKMYQMNIKNNLRGNVFLFICCHSTGSDAAAMRARPCVVVALQVVALSETDRQH